ncbi:hypothetical protein AVEN_138233-1 [Araneus ventricosus]|uniref:Mos1 transposase HTH domain-containing protein n=1 Tax=Araneus ventricosus TaxID=182803 RepID=A0A4Y2IP92_ARAVE|nr:hypothetical protein AVEN_138233-1 [Araneus ventricosus]
MPSKIDASAKCELRSVIRFLHTEGKSEPEILQRMSRIYGENFMSVGLCVIGAEKLKTGEPTFMIRVTRTQICRNRRSCTTSSWQLLEQFKLDVPDHPTYSPYLATSGYHLFLELKD